jgi:tyrosyl-tRNA synthetase
MQGWDSVEIRADIELGGTEQLFSLLVARELQVSQGQRPQVALTLPILVGTDGVRRMGKSLGNYIGVADDPNNMFGKVMSVPDTALRQYFTLLTDIPLEEVERWLGPEINPRDAKEAVGKAIVAQYWGPEKAEEAAAEFRRRAEGQDPAEIPDVAIAADQLDAQGRAPAPRLIVMLGLDASTSNARRLIEQGGVNVGPHREPVTDPKTLIAVSDGLIVRVGKRKIARIRLV